jgi:hypothetical protein
MRRAMQLRAKTPNVPVAQVINKEHNKIRRPFGTFCAKGERD